MDFIYERDNVSISITGVDEPGSVVSGVFITQRAHIEEALGRVPAFQLSMIPPINIVSVRPNNGGAYKNNPPEIRLHRSVFATDYNLNYLFTLLHEIGHAVDNHFHIVTTFKNRTHRRGREWEDYRAIHYGGRNRLPDGTPKHGEHFAEGYAHILTRHWRLTHRQQSLIRQLARL